MARTKGAKDKKPRKRAEVGNRPCDSSPVIQGHNPVVPPGYNTELVEFLEKITPTEPLNIHDVDEMQRRFDRYLRLCGEYDKKPGNMGAYLAIGINKDQAWDWANVDKGDSKRALFIKNVQQKCAFIRESLMNDNKVQPATGIFWQKNYDGLRDQQEVVVTPNNPLGELKDAESLQRKYLDSAYGLVEQVDTEPEKKP